MPLTLRTSRSRITTVGSMTPLTQFISLITSRAGLSPTQALRISTYAVLLWLPQTVTREIWDTGTPIFSAIMLTARNRASWLSENQCSAGTSTACDCAIRQLVLHGCATTRTRAVGAAWLMARPCSTMVGALARRRSRRFGHIGAEGLTSQENDPVRPLENLAGISPDLEIGKERIGTVPELHRAGLEPAKCFVKLQKSEFHRLLRTEQATGRDPEDQGVADTPRRAGDCNTNGFDGCHWVFVRLLIETASDSSVCRVAIALVAGRRARLNFADRSPGKSIQANPS